MSMITHVVGFRPADAKWRDMKAVWDACENAGVHVPAEVDKFFNGENPDEHGVRIDLEKSNCVQEWSNGEAAESGFDVNVKLLPPDVTVIRFYNAF